MKAAVVTDFHARWRFRTSRSLSPALARSSSRSSRAACATPTSMRARRLAGQAEAAVHPRSRGRRIVEGLGPGVTAARSATGSRSPGSATLRQCRILRRRAGKRCASSSTTPDTPSNGAFAEYARRARRLRDTGARRRLVLDAAPLTCAGVTTYKAIKVARVSPPRLVAVFGIGGLGHLAVQYARIAGASWSRSTSRTEAGDGQRARGRPRVNARADDPASAIQELGGADVAIALAASPASFDQAFRSLRRGGRLVCVGLPADKVHRRCRSSTPCSAASLSSARSSARATTSPRCSPSMRPAGHEWCRRSPARGGQRVDR